MTFSSDTGMIKRPSSIFIRNVSALLPRFLENFNSHFLTSYARKALELGRNVQVALSCDKLNIIYYN